MIIRRAFCIALIALGAGLDAYFYAFRFLADGVVLPVAIGAALALELLLAFAVWNAQHSKIFAGVAVAVTLYAVIQTSAGQTFSLLSRDALAGDVSAVSATVEEANRRTLDRLDDEAATITKQLRSIQTTEDRAAYAGTVWRMTARLAEIGKERDRVTAQMSSAATTASAEAKERVKMASIYDFYASMPGWAGMDWLKFLFHTALSILIAIMTPVGILTWNKEQMRRFSRSKITKKEVDVFVNRCWKKVRIGTGERILSESAFYEWCDRDGLALPLDVYPELVRRCMSLGIISKEGVAVIKDEEMIKEKILKGDA